MRKLSKHLFVLLAALTMLLCSAGIVQAAAPSCPKEQSIYTMKSTDGKYKSYTYVKLSNVPNGAKITVKASSSYAKVSVLTKPRNNSYTGHLEANKTIYVNLPNHKPGTKVVLTLNVTPKGSKKTSVLKCTLTVRELRYPLKSLKFGGKEYIKGIKKCWDQTIKLPVNKKIKLAYTANTGIKIKEVRINGKKVANNSSVTLHSGDKIRISYAYTWKPCMTGFQMLPEANLIVK